MKTHPRSTNSQRLLFPPSLFSELKNHSEFDKKTKREFVKTSEKTTLNYIFLSLIFPSITFCSALSLKKERVCLDEANEIVGVGELKQLSLEAKLFSRHEISG